MGENQNYMKSKTHIFQILEMQRRNTYGYYISKALPEGI